MTRLNRRAVLASTAAGAVALAVGGGATVALTSPVGLVRRTLERYLGPIPIADVEINSFIDGFTAGKSWLMPGTKLAKGYEATLAVGIRDAVTPFLPGDDRAEIDQFERRLLGAFLSTTNFGIRSDHAEPVVYLKDPACVNPFATF